MTSVPNSYITGTFRHVMKVMFVALALLCEYLQEVLVKIFHCSESYMA